MLTVLFGGVRGRVAALLGLLVFLSGAIMVLGPITDTTAPDPAGLPSTYPPFAMELERIVDGAVEGTIIITDSS